MKPRKLVHGVGSNNAGYAVTKTGIVEVNGVRKRRQVWMCPYYQTWKSMLARCYSVKEQKRSPTYIGCTVADEWLTFTNFKSWMEKQVWEGMQLDKDILIKGNKVYSPETCIFVTGAVNSFANDQVAKRGEWMIGVIWHKQAEKFRAECRNPITNKKEYLGLFTSEQKAHQVWLKRKQELAHELAAIQEDPRVAKSLINRYT